jgi:hypothetical protein
VKDGQQLTVWLLEPGHSGQKEISRLDAILIQTDLKNETKTLFNFAEGAASCQYYPTGTHQRDLLR